MSLNKPERRRAYHAPVLIPYGRLASITGAIPCTSLANKVGHQPDDVTPVIQLLQGDVKCL